MSNFVLMKQWVSYFILFSLLLVTVPREWVHHCEHTDSYSTFDDQGAEAHLQQDDCFACDYHLDVIDCFDLDLLRVHSLPVSQLYIELNDQVIVDMYGVEQRRGPPAIS